MDEDPLHRDAALAGEREGVRGAARGGVVDVGVGLDDDGRRVPELEIDALARCALAELPAHRAGAGERDERDARILDDHVADLGGRADEDVQPAGGEAGVVLELREEERREGSLRRGLEDDGAAGRERGRDLVRDEVEREVEGADRADDADREPHRERELALARLRGVHGNHLACELPCLDRRHRVGRHRARDLDPGGLERLARLGRDPARCLVGPLAERTGHAHEDVGALVRREGLAHCGLGRVDRRSRLGGAGLGHPPDKRPVVRRRDLHPVARIDPLAVDQQLALDRGHGHASTLRPPCSATFTP